MPPQVTQPTPRPVLIPAGTVIDETVEPLWSQDRGALLSCAAEKGVALNFYGQLANGLRGNPG